MNIELRLLRSLVAIYESGSLSRAAVRSHCSQAAMSMRLKLLEDQIGHRLFVRHHHHLEPTTLGSEVYAKALAVLASYDELVSTTRSRDEVHKVRIGVPDDYALSYVARVLRTVSRQVQGFEIEISCDLSANLVPTVQRQDIDLALVTVVSAPHGATLISETDLLWVHHSSWRPDRAATIPLAVYPEGCVFRRAMITALESAGRPWRIVAQGRSNAGVLAAVRGGIAATAMAEGTVSEELTVIEDEDLLPALSRVPIYLMRRPGEPTHAMAALERMITDQVESAAKLA